MIELKARLERKEHRMCLNSKYLQKSNTESVVSEDSSTKSVTRTLMSATVEHIYQRNLATRYFGRGSNIYITRALKRRMWRKRYPISYGRVSIRNASSMISPLSTPPSLRTSHSSPTSPTTRLSHSASTPVPASSQSAKKTQDEESVPVNCSGSNSESYKKKLRVPVSTTLPSPLSLQSSPTSQSSPLSQCSPPSICTRLSQSSMSPQPSTSLQSSLPSQTVESASQTLPQGEVSTLTDTLIPQKKRGRRPKVQPLKKNSFLETADAYFLSDYPKQSNEPCSSSPVDVPLWKVKQIKNFFQLEGTEDLNDTVFNKRHKECEAAERRRKRWDYQMQQNSKKANEKLKSGKSKKERNKEDIMTFLPDPEQLKFVDVSEKLPVIAFGHLIPHFQPCEFALTWCCEEKTKRRRLSTAGSKVT